ncbi:unnamed protein product [Polarella glacialis]|uniref:Uncharacterized protein n=1 Tax=Polarella glacialis TaxID=89957 RepID=A0A813D9X3_POLGL|nr:unnamed protein product [Polarella glacialis]
MQRLDYTASVQVADELPAQSFHLFEIQLATMCLRSSWPHELSFHLFEIQTTTSKALSRRPRAQNCTSNDWHRSRVGARKVFLDCLIQCSESQVSDQISPTVLHSVVLVGRVVQQAGERPVFFCNKSRSNLLHQASLQLPCQGAGCNKFSCNKAGQKPLLGRSC